MWTKNQGTMRFGYDGFGRRVRVDDAGTEKRFIYDGAHVFMELDVSGPIYIVAEYTYYPGLDRPHSVRRGGATGSTYYYAMDYPGNVVGLIDGNDDLAARYRYAPFGESELATGSLAQSNPLRFAAREYDATSGLYYMRARYYDPEVGRFISEDPLGLADGINPYLYANNNPLMGRDPTGLFEDEQEGWWVDDGSGCLLNGSVLWWCPHDPIIVSVPRGSRWYFADFDGFADRVNTYDGGGDHGGGAAIISLVGTTGGVASSLKEMEHIRGYGDDLQWLGRQGNWHRAGWGGNGSTGGRNAVMRAGKAARVAGRAFLAVNVGVSGVQAYHSYQAGQTKASLVYVGDIAMAVVGTFGGPVGLGVSVTYFGARYVWGP